MPIAQHLLIWSGSARQSGSNLDGAWAMTHSQTNPTASYFFNLKTTQGTLSLKSSLFPNLQGHHYLKGHSQIRFSRGVKFSGSPRNPWAMGPPAPRASWREPRRTGERAPSVNDKRSVSGCKIRGHSARDNYSRAAVMDLLSQPIPTCNPMHSMVFTATSKYVANDHGGNTTKQK